MASASRAPRVVSRHVTAPLRSISALATRVVPWTTSPTRAGSTSASSRATPSATATEGSAGVVSALPTPATRPSTSRTRSVNVPPMSTPIRARPGAPSAVTPQRSELRLDDRLEGRQVLLHDRAHHLHSDVLVGVRCEVPKAPDLLPRHLGIAVLQLVRQLRGLVRECHQRPHDGTRRRPLDVRKRFGVAADVPFDQVDAFADVLERTLIALRAHRATASLSTAVANLGDGWRSSVTCTGRPRSIASSSSRSLIRPT